MKAIRKLTSCAVPAGLAHQPMQCSLQPTVKGKGASTVNTPATIRSSVRVLCVVIGIGAGAFHEAHADSAAAAIGTSVPLSQLRCFTVVFGAVRNDGHVAQEPGNGKSSCRFEVWVGTELISVLPSPPAKAAGHLQRIRFLRGYWDGRQLQLLQKVPPSVATSTPC